MAKTLRKVKTFDASPDALLAAVTDPEFVKRRMKPGTSAGAAVREVSRDERRLVQELDSDDYARTRTGGIDRTRIEPSVTHYEWDLAARTCVWTWRGPQDARVGLRGRIAVRAAGAGSELETVFEVDVRIPLIGGLIERVIAGELEEDLPRFEQEVRAALARR
ncbi:MAG: DUF2505 family protein [Deltaproteobacteria bacterium]|nr:DUF2505 family protein [Deltaproteobacteria bacterium]